eukprot:scaffold244591_cov20-Tisochrysis_lutea.AAC.1
MQQNLLCGPVGIVKSVCCPEGLQDGLCYEDQNREMQQGKKKRGKIALVGACLGFEHAQFSRGVGNL